MAMLDNGMMAPPFRQFIALAADIQFLSEDLQSIGQIANSDIYSNGRTGQIMKIVVQTCSRLLRASGSQEGCPVREISSAEASKTVDELFILNNSQLRPSNSIPQWCHISKINSAKDRASVYRLINGDAESGNGVKSELGREMPLFCWCSRSLKKAAEQDCPQEYFVFQTLVLEAFDLLHDSWNTVNQHHWKSGLNLREATAFACLIVSMCFLLSPDSTAEIPVDDLDVHNKIDRKRENRECYSNDYKMVVSECKICTKLQNVVTQIPFSFLIRQHICRGMCSRKEPASDEEYFSDEGDRVVNFGVAPDVRRAIISLYFADIGIIMGGPNVNSYKHLQEIAEICECIIGISKRDTVSKSCKENNLPLSNTSNLREMEKIQRVALCRSTPYKLEPVESKGISIEEFLTHYLIQKKPILIPVSTWGYPKEDFMRKMENRLVPVEIGRCYADAEWHLQLMTYGEFSKRFLGQTASTDLNAPFGFLALHPLFVQCPDLEKTLAPPDLVISASDSPPLRLVWVGGAGSSSRLHFDTSENIYTVVGGTKRCLLYPPDQASLLYPIQEGPLKGTTSSLPPELLSHRASGYCSTPPEVFNLWRSSYPLFLSNSIGLECFIRKGDALYIPKGWWHFVESIEDSIAISNWF